MTSLLVTSDWITPQGGAGISQMEFGNTDPVDSSQASSCVDAVGDFFDALKANFPTSVTISVRSIVETITLDRLHDGRGHRWERPPDASRHGRGPPAGVVPSVHPGGR